MNYVVLVLFLHTYHYHCLFNVLKSATFFQRMYKIIWKHVSNCNAALINETHEKVERDSFISRQLQSLIDS